MADDVFKLLTKGNLKIDPVKLSEWLRSGDGPATRELIVVGEAVRQTTVKLLREGFPRNFLAPSIVKRILTGPQGVTVLVGSDRLKTKPHVIRGNPTLVFNWPKAGGVVFFRSVNHPGSNFGAYLSKKLLEAVAATKGIR